MRTKTLLITAAIGAAAAVATHAQVYSVNAVGYINLSINAGWNIAANQLDAGDNTVPNLFAGVPGGTTIYTYDNETGYESSAYDADFEEWSKPGMELTPGMGFWVRSGEDMTVTLVGEVPQGEGLTVALFEGFNLVSSIVPQAGGLVTDLGYPVGAGDQIFVYDTVDGYSSSTWDADFEEWSNGEPMIAVGQGFWVRTGEDKNWVRDFSVNPVNP